MRTFVTTFGICGLLAAATTSLAAQTPGAAPVDPVRALVSGLTLDKYKATIKGLAQYGDRRQGTKRNRDAVDWIEAQLKSYGCTNTERVTYQYTGTQLRRPAPVTTTAATPPARGNANGGAGGAANAAANRGTGNATRGGGAQTPPPPTVNGTEVNGTLVGTTSVRAWYSPRAATGVNVDSLKQPDARIRALDAEPDQPGERQEVFCTKIGKTHPEEMYIVGGHMDGHGFNEAVNDDASGTALVMELARILNQPGVETDRSIRFVLWNNEETGLNGAKAYIEQRAGLQGIENPKGSGKYPEPKWLGMIQHDMMMWDHGAPDSNGNVSPVQRKEADINIEFAWNAKLAKQGADLAWFFRGANERYATDYPATVGFHMSNTDSDPFKDLVPAISLRENERLMHTGNGWNPTWHQPTDVWATFSDKDFLLGMNAAQTTLSAIALLTGATIKK